MKHQTAHCSLKLYGTVLFLLILPASLFQGCGTIISGATREISSNLAAAIAAHEDPATVKEAIPSYLILLDSFILKEKKPSHRILSDASLLGSAYTSFFVKEPLRAIPLSQKALDYALMAACDFDKSLCSVRGLQFQAYSSKIGALKKRHVHILYTLGIAWANWLSVRQDDFMAITDLSKIELILEKVVSLDETYMEGDAHTYLGIISSLLPPALGGHPEKGEYHFKRALDISREQNLMAKVAYARYYARMIFDRNLHDTLLKEVLSASTTDSSHNLSNAIAKKQAQELLETADSYF